MSSQPANLIRASLIAGLILLTPVSCSTTKPHPVTNFAQARTIQMETGLPAGTLCLLGTDRRCSAMFPEPARACLTGIERCPRDARVEPLTEHR